DCTARPSDCTDVRVLNELDGFNLEPRLSVPFTGPIDPSSVSIDHVNVAASAVFLFKLGPDSGFVAINQVVWDPVTNTLYAEPAPPLAHPARHMRVPPTRVRDPAAHPLASSQFRVFLKPGQPVDPADAAYRADLLAALDELDAAGVPPGRVAAAS